MNSAINATPKSDLIWYVNNPCGIEYKLQSYRGCCNAEIHWPCFVRRIQSTNNPRTKLYWTYNIGPTFHQKTN